MKRKQLWLYSSCLVFASTVMVGTFVRQNLLAQDDRAPAKRYVNPAPPLSTSPAANARTVAPRIYSAPAPPIYTAPMEMGAPAVNTNVATTISPQAATSPQAASFAPGYATTVDPPSQIAPLASPLDRSNGIDAAAADATSLPTGEAVSMDAGNSWLAETSQFAPNSTVPALQPAYRYNPYAAPNPYAASPVNPATQQAVAEWQNHVADEQEIQSLLLEYQNSTDANRRRDLVNQITAKVTSLFEKKQQARERELKELETQLAKLREKHARREQLKQNIVADRVSQLVNHVDGLGWGTEATRVLPTQPLSKTQVLYGFPSSMPLQTRTENVGAMPNAVAPAVPFPMTPVPMIPGAPFPMNPGAPYTVNPGLPQAPNFNSLPTTSPAGGYTNPSLPNPASAEQPGTQLPIQPPRAMTTRDPSEPTRSIAPRQPTPQEFTKELRPNTATTALPKKRTPPADLGEPQNLPGEGLPRETILPNSTTGLPGAAPPSAAALPGADALPSAPTGTSPAAVSEDRAPELKPSPLLDDLDLPPKGADVLLEPVQPNSEPKTE